MYYFQTWKKIKACQDSRVDLSYNKIFFVQFWKNLIPTFLDVPTHTNFIYSSNDACWAWCMHLVNFCACKL